MTRMSYVNAEFGAPMGRFDVYQEWPLGKVRLYRVRINSGGYDDGGAYWGLGLPLYCAEDASGRGQFERAGSRIDAASRFQKQCSVIIPWVRKP